LVTGDIGTFTPSVFIYFMRQQGGQFAGASALKIVGIINTNKNFHSDLSGSFFTMILFMGKLP